MTHNKKKRPDTAATGQNAQRKTYRFQFTAPEAKTQGPRLDFYGPALVQQMERMVLGREKVGD